MFSHRASGRCCVGRRHARDTHRCSAGILGPFRSILGSPTPGGLVVIRLLNARVGCGCHCPRGRNGFSNGASRIPPKLDTRRLRSCGSCSGTGLCGSRIITDLVGSFGTTSPGKFLICFSSRNRRICSAPPRGARKHGRSGPAHRVCAVPFLL